ncbi:hypothetical protein ES705_30505 [subsurface metagenome]
MWWLVCCLILALITVSLASNHSAATEALKPEVETRSSR